MHRNTIRSCCHWPLLLLLYASIALFGGQSAANAQSIDPSLRILTDDLDLTSRRSRIELDHRIRATARKVCRDRPAPLSSMESTEFQRCTRDAIGGAEEARMRLISRALAHPPVTLDVQRN